MNKVVSCCVVKLCQFLLNTKTVKPEKDGKQKEKFNENPVQRVEREK